MRLVCLSDTHGCHNYLDVPQGDILIHCGDAELNGYGNYEEFLYWFAKQKHKYKIFVPGNHDFYIQDHQFNCTLEFEKRGISLLIDKAVVLNNVKFYGSPWTPTFMDWAFMKDDDELFMNWEEIPHSTDILITHGPAYGNGDCVKGKKQHLGSKTLDDAISYLPNIKHHLYGHIHTGVPTGIAHNCSVLNEEYKLVNKATILEI